MAKKSPTKLLEAHGLTREQALDLRHTFTPARKQWLLERSPCSVTTI
jgi:hypothetical protein